MIMEQLISWSGFLGAWLLVAGPLYQASVELEEEDFERDSFSQAAQTVAAPAPVSRWWWLIPPLGYLLHRQRARSYRELVIRAISRDQREQLVQFSAKATGWGFVAAGAFFIAVKETWELHELYQWPVALFWILIPAMVVLAALQTAVRQKRNRELLTDSDPAAS